MDTLLFSLNTVLPILILMGLGYTLKHLGFVNEHFLQIGNKFVFRVALPTLLFYTIYSIQSFQEINWSIIIYAVGAVLLLFIIGLILAMVFIKDSKQKGVLIQSVFRANYAIIGIPLAQAMGGEQAVIVVALISAVVVPLMNILAVISLTLFVKNENEAMHPIRSTLIKVTKNPLIIAIFVGLIVIWIRSYIPIDPDTLRPVFTLQYNVAFLYTAIVWVKQIASPFALIVLGGTFEFFVIKNLSKQIFLGTFSRIVLAPMIALGLAVIVSKYTTFFNFDSVEFPALIALFASPTAVSGAVMAKEMNNDEALAVQYVVWTTSLSIISIFIIVFIFRLFHLI
ncbi:MAG: AEC family transporter [Bacilli bacterium]|nr:AEC family transporter [Bacilli bacterium]MBN2877247.1 AEC family transporter [Bacilli bacterium]